MEIDPSDRPDAPKGFTDEHMYSLAVLMARIMKTAFSVDRPRHKDADSHLSHVLLPITNAFPRTVADFRKMVGRKYDPLPWQHMLVDRFDPDSQPHGKPHILKVDWDAKVRTYRGERYVDLRLQVHAAYEVGPASDKRIIGVRRHVQIYSYGPNYWPSLGAGVFFFGNDNCLEARTGTLSPTSNLRVVERDRRLLKSSLADDSIVVVGGASKSDIQKTIDACEST